MAQAARSTHPSGVAVDSEGDVYVSDWGNKLVKIYENDGSVLTQLEGDAVEFSKWAKEVVESNPDVVKAYRRVKDTRPLGLFNRPVGIAVDEERPHHHHGQHARSLAGLRKREGLYGPRSSTCSSLS